MVSKIKKNILLFNPLKPKKKSFLKEKKSLYTLFLK